MFSHQHLYLIVFSKNFIRFGVGSNGESRRDLPVLLGFVSRKQCHMWVDFVLVLFLTPRGLSLSAPVLTLPHPEKETQKVSSYKFCGPTNHIYIFSPFPVSKVNYSRESGEDVTSPKHGKVRFGVRQTTTRTRFSQY